MMLLKVRGKPSTTFTIIVISWACVTGMFLWKGTAADITPYAAAVAALIVPWIGREYIEKVSAQPAKG